MSVASAPSADNGPPRMDYLNATHLSLDDLRRAKTGLMHELVADRSRLATLPETTRGVAT